MKVLIGFRRERAGAGQGENGQREGFRDMLFKTKNKTCVTNKFRGGF